MSFIPNDMVMDSQMLVGGEPIMGERANNYEFYHYDELELAFTNSYHESGMDFGGKEA